MIPILTYCRERATRSFTVSHNETPGNTGRSQLPKEYSQLLFNSRNGACQNDLVGHNNCKCLLRLCDYHHNLNLAVSMTKSLLRSEEQKREVKIYREKWKAIQGSVTFTGKWKFIEGSEKLWREMKSYRGKWKVIDGSEKSQRELKSHWENWKVIERSEKS